MVSSEDVNEKYSGDNDNDDNDNVDYDYNDNDGEKQKSCIGLKNEKKEFAFLERRKKLYFLEVFFFAKVLCIYSVCKQRVKY